MKKPWIRNILIGAAVLVALNIVYLAFMTACYSVPVTERTKVHLEETMEILAPETKESPVFRNVKALSTGLFTDMLWIDTAIMHEESAFEMAVTLPHKEVQVGEMWFPDEGFQGLMIPVMYYYDDPGVITVRYQRYWMLFTGLIRVLFQFFAWNEIRYLFYSIAAALLLYDGCMIMKRCGWRALIPFGVAVMMRNLLFHVISFTTCTDTIMTFAAIAFLVTFYEKTWYRKYRWLFYLIVGSLTFAIGTMEAPLLVLGMTMLTELLFMRGYQTEDDLRMDKAQMKKVFFEVFFLSFLWCVGYASAAVGKGMIVNMTFGGTGAGEEAFLHYLSSNGRGPFVRFYRIFYCLDMLFTPVQIKGPMMVFLLIVILVLMKKRGIKKFPYMWQILMVALYPVAWAMIVVEHSIHNYASNIFSVFVYGILAVLCGLVREETGDVKMLTDTTSHGGLSGDGEGEE